MLGFMEMEAPDVQQVRPRRRNSCMLVCHPLGGTLGWEKPPGEASILLKQYQTTFEPRWHTAAQEFAEAMIAHINAPKGLFSDTCDHHEALITRPRDLLQDNAQLMADPIAAIRQRYDRHRPAEADWLHE